jgi:AP-1 complex subunit sigma 1/2
VQLPRVQRCAGLISTGTSSAASHHILADEKLCSIDSKVVYRRYASLFFIAGCASTDNELITLEIVHRYVEQMDKYYGNVCELDIIFNFQKAYFILDELLLAGEMQESSKKNVLRCISQEDSLEDMEVSQENLLAVSYQIHLEYRCFWDFSSMPSASPD